MTYHGGAPRVRKEKNDEETKIIIDTEMLFNKAADAAISAGVSYIVASAIK